MTEKNENDKKKILQLAWFSYNLISFARKHGKSYVITELISCFRFLFVK